MEIIKIENLTFSYPASEKKILKNINISVKPGEFVTVCGKSGCGKTTLLRLLKTSLAPHGHLEGNIIFDGRKLEDVGFGEQAAKIGFVLQSPDNQIVTDKVWHELAFGLESLGLKTSEIRARVSEMASFFGIAGWFHKKVTELSGGQKQLLNLASVMVMQPSVLILDEPTSQLDPIAAQEFLKTLEKINKELGTTVILTEHRLEDAFPISGRVIVMDEGEIIADAEPKRVGEILNSLNHDMYEALPAPMRVYSAVERGKDAPLSVRDGRIWLEAFAEKNTLKHDAVKQTRKRETKETVIELNDVWFRYEKGLSDVIKGFDLKVFKGELFAILGGNGTGKSTALTLISGLNTPYRGKVLIKDKKVSEIQDLYNGVLGVLPQNPETLFVKKTVYEDLLEMVSDKKAEFSQKEEWVKNVSELCRITELAKSHPYDLSGGEKQRAALAKILLKNPHILLLDEPTKGMDASFKECFAEILENLKENGITIVMVSHDLEFCAKNADRCALMFDGNLTSCGEPREFFAGKNFYTTSSNRMARTTVPEAVLAEDIILACGGTVKKRNKEIKEFKLPKNEKTIESPKKNKKLSLKRIVFGVFFAILFIVTCVLGYGKLSGWKDYIYQFITILELFLCFSCFFPQKEQGIENVKGKNKKLGRRTVVSCLLVLLLIPLTVFFGVFYLADRKYYFISLLIILEVLIPFFIAFEGRKPEAREYVLISALCAIAVAGRSAFFMVPQFKPVVALTIISGVCFGGETGFLVGAVSGFASNFLFGQGPWTPWQMFAFGIIGFLAGILFKKDFLAKNRSSLCIFGGLATVIIYGGIMNPATVITSGAEVTFEMIVAKCLLGLPFDLIHAASTVFFLWFLSGPMIYKLERIKLKYGLIEK